MYMYAVVECCLPSVYLSTVVIEEEEEEEEGEGEDSRTDQML